MTFTAPHTKTCGFMYLRPLATKEKRVDSSMEESTPNTKPSKPRRVGRWIGAALGLVNVAAIASSFYVAQVPKAQRVAATSQPSAAARLYEHLGSAEYLQFVEQFQRDQAAALLAEAEVELKNAENASLVASYKLADGLLPYAPGEEIKTTTAVEVRCAEDEQGAIAYVRQIAGEYQDGAISHLASCNSGRLESGGVIGVAGENQAAIRNGS